MFSCLSNKHNIINKALSNVLGQMLCYTTDLRMWHLGLRGPGFLSETWELRMSGTCISHTLRHFYHINSKLIKEWLFCNDRISTFTLPFGALLLTSGFKTPTIFLKMEKKKSLPLCIHHHQDVAQAFVFLWLCVPFPQNSSLHVL